MEKVGRRTWRLGGTGRAVWDAAAMEDGVAMRGRNCDTFSHHGRLLVEEEVSCVHMRRCWLSNRGQVVGRVLGNF